MVEVVLGSRSSERGVVLITGCSTGFGLHTAVALRRDGWRVIATMRDLGKRGALDVASAGIDLDVLQLDVCDQASIDRAVAQILALTGRIDAVIHNAGVAHAGFFEDIPDERVRQVMETNFFGVLALTRAVLPAMRAQRRGRIVVMSSTSAFVPEPAFSSYAASKFAVEGWTQSVGVEVAPFGIDVVLIEPGTYKTEIWSNATVAKPEGSAYRAFAEAMEPRVRANVDRNGRDPAEVAALIVKVLGAKRPSLRHPIGPNSRVMWAMSRLLPYSARRRILAHETGLAAVAKRT
jgi:NAD(P)-dependent dehydrogenase (short-subunit alcohol dehydrogenase family)